MFAAIHQGLAARSPGVRTAALALVLLAGSAVPGAAQAALMTVTLNGTISSGFDAYRNSVYFGPTGGYNLTGMAATISITYDTALLPNQAAGTNYLDWHQPAYPYFYGTVGQNPVRSASFTVNGVTLALDVGGPGEVGILQVQDYNPAADSFNLRGGDNRTTWCPNDSQCVESGNIQAYSTVNLFDADGYGPADAYTWSATASTSLTGSVRMYENIVCQPADQGGSGGAAGLCPQGRFTDYGTNPGAIHWVEFQLNGTQLNIAPTAVPLPAAGWLLATGLGGLAAMRRRVLGSAA